MKNSQWLAALGAGWVALVLLAPCAVQAQAAAAPRAVEAKRGFLWEARKGERRLTLLGTIHVGRPEFATLSADVSARLAEAPILAVEADATNAQKSIGALQRYAIYAEGEPSLEQRLDPKLRARLDALLTRYGLAPPMVARMKPWFVSINLVMSEFARGGLNPAQGTEAVLIPLASRDGKKVVELEGVEAQFKLLDGAPAATQMAYLEQTIRSIESGSAETEVRKIADAWASRDYAAAEQLLVLLRTAARTGVAERFVVEQLLDGRHPKMLDEIERLPATAGAPLVAVGSLHYFGPNGLVAGLRGRGWTVTEVR